MSRRDRDLPPARAEALLRRLTPSRSAAYVVADLGEEYRELRGRRSRLFCRAWYWLQAWRLAARFLLRGIGADRSHDIPGRERTTMLDTLRQDLLFAWRTFGQAPGFALVAVLTLAVGIGANTAIFSVVHGVLQALPYPAGERVVLVYEGDAETRSRGFMLSPGEAATVEELEGEVFEVAAAYRYSGATVPGDPNPVTVSTPMITHDFMTMLDQTPVLGRGFAPDEDADSKVVVLGHELWQERYGGDEGVLGEEILLDGNPHTIIGVSSPDFTYFNDTDRLFLPLAVGPDRRVDPGSHSVFPLVRLRADVSLAEAEERLAAAIAATQEAAGHQTQRPHGVWLHSLYEAWVGSVRSPLLVLMGAVGLLVLIACSNVAGLQLARGLGRGREIAVRLALGAGRGRVGRQLVTESTLLALLGGGLGLLVAFASVGWLRAMVESQLPRTENIAVDGRVFLFALGLSLVAGILSGLAPAWIASRRDLARPLTEGSITVAGGGGGKLRAGLLVTEVALAVVLAVGAGLLTRSFLHLQAVDLGFEPRNVVASTLSFRGLSPERTEPGQMRTFTARLQQRIEAFPGVESVGTINMAPGGGGSGWMMLGARLLPDETASVEEPLQMPFRVVTPGAFETLGMSLRGRDFGSGDTADGEPVAILSESLAGELWPGEDAIGHRLREIGRDGSEGPWIRVVGVVDDVRSSPLSEAGEGLVYLPYAQRPLPMITVVARLHGPAGDFGDRFRHAVAEMDPAQPVGSIRMLEDSVAGQIAGERVNGALLGLFAVLALVLAAVGEYAVIQHMVAQRRDEIGVRLALGARGGRILAMVVSRGLALAGAGVALGLAGAWASSRLLRNMLHGIEPVDPPTYAAVGLLLLAVAAVASLVPARRASRIDPVVALRED